MDHPVEKEKVVFSWKMVILPLWYSRHRSVPPWSLWLPESLSPCCGHCISHGRLKKQSIFKYLVLGPRNEKETQESFLSCPCLHASLQIGNNLESQIIKSCQTLVCYTHASLQHTLRYAQGISINTQVAPRQIENKL